MSNRGFPVRYLSLRGSSGWPTLLHDIIPTVITTALISSPFLLIQTSNYFHKEGFLDKFGTFSSVLTGFYVAGLVAVATFTVQSGALDEKIENGPVFLWEISDEADNQGKLTKAKLTRREYLCQMFGYLATLSMCLTLLTIVAIIIAQATSLPSTLPIPHFPNRELPVSIPRGIAIILFCVPISHLIITTARALHYLVERLYEKTPRIKSKPKGAVTES